MKKIFFLILGITLSIAVVMNKEAASQDKQAPKIRIGEFTGSSGEAVDETESATPQSLTDSDVEFMYGAGFFDDEGPYGLFRQRFSVAYNLLYITNHPYTTVRGGIIVPENRMENYSNGIAIQYQYGISFIRDLDWRGNPLLGVNLLLDGSFGFGRAGNIISLGIGGEVHFLWILKIAAGLAYIHSENRIFKSGEHPYVSSNSYSTYVCLLPLKDNKSAKLPFFQGGISIPVSSKFDVFALVNFIGEEWRGNDNSWYFNNGTREISYYSERPTLYIFSFRLGVAQKF